MNTFSQKCPHCSQLSSPLYSSFSLWLPFSLVCFLLAFWILYQHVHFKIFQLLLAIDIGIGILLVLYFCFSTGKAICARCGKPWDIR